MIYLTYAEPPSGVYASQVTDVIRFLNTECKADIRLIAFISLRDFRNQRRKLKEKLPDAIVVPMLPKATFWKFNTIILGILCIALKEKIILARNVIACNMALRLKKSGILNKVGFDGRGAIAAEWKEYDVQVDPAWKNEIDILERDAVLQSDVRLAVTHHLVDYWKQTYGYNAQDHVVIPCTLNSVFTNTYPDENKIREIRAKQGYAKDDIVMAYSGSTAGWQSFRLVQPLLKHYLSLGNQYKALFLSPDEPNIRELASEFPAQVKRAWVSHTDVPGVLQACDLGILVRDQSITNRVASPTKFAEYLAAGLPVAISANLGDYSEFVTKYRCGFIVNGNTLPALERNSPAEQVRLNRLANETCTKEACKPQYMQLLDYLK
jgi:hypothetical protein